MYYYPDIKKNAFQSFLMRRMNLEPIIKSKISQKQKDKYCILTHIYGIWKDGTDEPTCRAAMESQTLRTGLWTGLGKKERMGCMDRGTRKHILPYVKQIANGNLLYDSGDSNQGSVTT